MIKRVVTVFLALTAFVAVRAQNYPPGLIEKTVAIVGGEVITIGQIEQEILQLRANGGSSDANMRCEVLENMLDSKLFLMQARLDSLTINQDMVTQNMDQQADYLKTALGGDQAVEDYFGKPLYKLRQEWKKQLEDNSLIEQERAEVAATVPESTPYDVKKYIEKMDPDDMPVVPVKYQLSQICIYPDREAANLAVKEKLLDLRERIINGEKFSTLAMLYSEDPGSARRGGELGMSSRSMFWTAFSDAAMALKPGTISQIVETPDGFHIIEVIEKQGDMFNARHILMKPQYTVEDQEKAFKTLDSLRTEINNEAVTFELAARFYSQDPSTRTNGGQMADPQTGSSYFEIDQLKPQDYNAIKDLQPGEISVPVESLDNEGRNGNTVYKIVRVDKIIPAHTATLENDYSELVTYVQNEKALEALDKFINEKMKSTYIIIDPIFKECDFNREGWKEIASRE